MNEGPQTQARKIFAESSQYLVGGVTAGARSTPLFDTPFFAEHAAGSRITDVDGKTYLDLHTSFGAALLGHGHPRVTAAVHEALSRGILCAFEVEASGIAARKLVEMLPCAERVRFSGTGTETTYQVIKLARAFTGKNVVIKFEGHFHGFNDYLQYNYWPTRGAGLPDLHLESAGALTDMAEHIIVLPFNDVDALERTILARKDEIAAVILEPVSFNCGGIRSRPDFLKALRTLTADHHIVLIFDEILSGFRTGPGCMQAHLGVTPDLCTIGKALGGGLPLSAFAGRAEIMDLLTPVGKVVHTGTYLAHPTAIFACNAFLDEISRPEFWPDLLDSFGTPVRRAAPDHRAQGRQVPAAGHRGAILSAIRPGDRARKLPDGGRCAGYRAEWTLRSVGHGERRVRLDGIPSRHLREPHGRGRRRDPGKA